MEQGYFRQRSTIGSFSATADFLLLVLLVFLLLLCLSSYMLLFADTCSGDFFPVSVDQLSIRRVGI